MGIGDEARDDRCDDRRGGGGARRPRRARGSARLDVPPSTRARIGASLRSRRADRPARHAPYLLQLRLRGGGGARRRTGRDGVCRVLRLGVARHGRGTRRLGRLGCRGHDRRSRRARARAAAAEAHRRRDPRGGSHGAVPGARRRAARVRQAGPERLGARPGVARSQGAALDGDAELAGHVRPLRPQRHVPVGRPRRGDRARVPHRPRLRRLGDAVLRSL